MPETGWFEGIPSVGELTFDRRADYLAAVEDPSAAQPAQAPAAGAADTRPFGLGEKQPFDHTGSQIGYIGESAGDLRRIVDTRDLEPERALAGQRVTVTLTQALVVRYPGRGDHQILFHLEAGERGGSGERFQFSATLRTGDGNTPAAIGQMLFSGLTVGADGVSIRLKTINVRSDGDEQLLAVLQSDVLRHGLDLVSSLGPAVGLLSASLGSIANWIAGRGHNKPVQDGLLALGLDRAVIDAPKLRSGTYVLAQAPATVDGRVWSWEDYRYDPSRGAIVQTRAPERAIEFNYVALAIAPVPT